MTKKRVVVKGGGKNLYYVSDTSGTYYVYKGGFGGTQIGKTKSMEDALSLIKSESGREIESIG